MHSIGIDTTFSRAKTWQLLDTREPQNLIPIKEPQLWVSYMESLYHVPPLYHDHLRLTLLPPISLPHTRLRRPSGTFNMYNPLTIQDYKLQGEHLIYAICTLVPIHMFDRALGEGLSSTCVKK